jgi:tRNA (guanine-N7-)-methyltransferase
MTLDPKLRPKKLKRLRQHTNPLAFQGEMTRPDWTAALGGPPQELEIGFGLGELLLARAQAHRDRRIAGVDVRWAYVEMVRKDAAACTPPLTNLFLVHAEGKVALTSWFDEGSIEDAIVYFPDPWFKRSHAKRRFIRPDTIALLTQVLASGGRLHLATDQEFLGAEMLKLLDAEPLLENAHGAGHFGTDSTLGAMSGREVEHLARGERIWRLLYTRKPR